MPRSELSNNPLLSCSHLSCSIWRSRSLVPAIVSHYAQAGSKRAPQALAHHTLGRETDSTPVPVRWRCEAQRVGGEEWYL